MDAPRHRGFFTPQIQNPTPNNNFVPTSTPGNSNSNSKNNNNTAKPETKQDDYSKTTSPPIVQPTTQPQPQPQLAVQIDHRSYELPTEIEDLVPIIDTARSFPSAPPTTTTTTTSTEKPTPIQGPPAIFTPGNLPPIQKNKPKRTGNVAVNKDFSPLHQAAFDYDLVRLLAILSSGPDYLRYINSGENLNGYYAIHLVAECPDIALGYEMCMALIRTGANPNVVNFKRMHVLHKAAQTGNIPLIKYLVEYCRIDPNIKDSAQIPPILLAAEKGKIEALNLFLSYGVQLNVPSFLGNIPLHQAATTGQFEMVRYLVDLGTPVNIQSTQKGCTPLYYAVERGHLEIVRFLISRGADINIKRFDGVFPLYMAAQKGFLEIVQLLIQNGANVNDYFQRPVNTPINIAKKKGFGKVVRELEKHGAHQTGGCVLQ